MAILEDAGFDLPNLIAAVDHAPDSGRGFDIGEKTA
jgi:hypothetical protein